MAGQVTKGQIEAMRTFWVLFSALLIAGTAVAQERTVRVKNPAPFDRKIETVEVPLNALKGLRGDGPLCVFEGGKAITSQTIDSSSGAPALLLFRSAFRKGQEKTFVVKRAPAGPLQGTADAKYILPRKDVAWENDRIAFRIYGGPLAGDVLGGLDVWVKRVPYRIIDHWYAGDSLKGSLRVSYHVDHGEGADFFNVGRSLGAGACAYWKDGAIHQAGMFTRERIIAAGPIRASFTVSYAFDSARGLPFEEVKTYSLDEGENLNRIDVDVSGTAGMVELAAGLVKRTDTSPARDGKRCWLSLWGRTNEDPSTGSLGTGIVVPHGTFRGFAEDKDHFLIIMRTSADHRLTYYAGACWSRSGDFPHPDDWNGYLASCARRLEYPLTVTIGRAR